MCAHETVQHVGNAGNHYRVTSILNQVICERRQPLDMIEVEMAKQNMPDALLFLEGQRSADRPRIHHDSAIEEESTRAALEWCWGLHQGLGLSHGTPAHGFSPRICLTGRCHRHRRPTRARPPHGAEATALSINLPGSHLTTGAKIRLTLRSDTMLEEVRRVLETTIRQGRCNST